MKKIFCDICGKPAKTIEPFSIVFPHKLKVDLTAKIQIRIHLNFVEHSSGFEGNPDLCDKCLIRSLKPLVNKVKEKKNEVRWLSKINH